MPKIRIISGIIAIASLVFLAGGCKKEETTALFALTGGSSFHFEYGQTKRASFSSRHIVRWHDAETPKGWGCVRSGEGFVITAPTQSAIEAGSADAKGTVKVSCDTDKGNTLSRDITVSIKLAEEIAQGANCIIVSGADKRYKFDATHRPGESNPSLSGATQGFLVWSTTKGGIMNVSFENGFLYFATAEQSTLVRGNAVVAVADGSGRILWSWHLWVTDFDPAAAPDVMDGATVMNRNLGAFASSGESDDKAWSSYGLYYQWGRKDPFAGPGAWNSSTTQAIYDAAGKAITYKYIVPEAATGTIDWAIANPSTFIAGAEKNGFDWLFAGQVADRWISSGAKSLYDPCPAGWRVAPPTIWRGFTEGGVSTTEREKFNVEGDYNYGWNFRNGEGAIFYPAAGRRSFSPDLAKEKGNFTNIINDGMGKGRPVGFYWSSAYPDPPDPPAVPLPRMRSCSLVFRGDYINPASHADTGAEWAPAGGFPLRCVKM